MAAAVPGSRPSGFRERVLGLIALAEQNYDVAIRRLRAGTEIGACTTCGWYDPGRAYEAAGQPAEAIAAYTKFVDAPDGGGRVGRSGMFLGFALDRVAALHEAAGDFANAAKYSARLLELWQHADPPLQPYVNAARARLQRRG